MRPTQSVLCQPTETLMTHVYQSNVKQTEVSTEPAYPDLFAQISYSPIGIDELAQKLDLSVESLLIQLLELELQALIVAENGLYRRA
ncbi:DprA-like winged helix domain-containing protein [Pasteurella canis]|uniref:DprA-like winged helix domain-containing protein n=1 Tax=Pasteurella canis TaxID=753 RepID=UPI0021E3ADC6|nr:hypothetical protein [Pasteurella canis]